MSSDEWGEGMLEVGDGTDADVELLMDLARVAYPDVVTRQFDKWEQDVHGKRQLEKIADRLQRRQLLWNDWWLLSEGS